MATMLAWHNEDADIYEDRGCEYSPKCVDCPLPKCKDEVPGLAAKARNIPREMPIVLAVRSGERVIDVAKQNKLTDRTIHRIVKKWSRGAYRTLDIEALARDPSPGGIFTELARTLENAQGE